MKNAVIEQVIEMKLGDTVIGLKILMKDIQHNIEDEVEYYTFVAPIEESFRLKKGTIVQGDWHYVRDTTFKKVLDSKHPLVTQGSVKDGFQIERNGEVLTLNNGEKAQIGDIFHHEGIRRSFEIEFDSKLTFS